MGLDMIGSDAESAGMTKEELMERVKGLLKTNDARRFLLKLKVEELKILVARIRERVDQVGR
jgi:hypothetical protein